MRLIVTEKPSVARDIARVLGIKRRASGYLDGGETRVTWCVGHLVELAEPHEYDPQWRSWRLDTLPMVPESFRLRARKGGEDQYRVVRELLRDRAVDEVVNACDAGREGELIFAYVYELAGCRAPVQRLWISSMTDGAIRKGLGQLRSGASMQPLEAAARCRSEADWLVGLNATRALTLRMRQGGEGRLLSVGRVQTPTLALIVEREEAIEAFVPEDFWQVKARFAVEAGSWEALWTTPPRRGEKPQNRLFDKALAEQIVARTREAGRGTVTRVERKKSREQPPLLYDLTNLQKEANRRFGFTASRTLELAQALYEQHKVLTYPRTDSRHLAKDHVAGIPPTLKSLQFGPYQAAAQDVLQRWPVKLSKRVVDDAEVSDHHAIIPTGVDPRPLRMKPDEKRVFDLVARRFLAALHPDAVFAVARIETRVGEDLFVARGRTCLEPGWRTIDPPRSKKKEVLLPPVEQGDEAEVKKADLHQGRTKPPQRLNEATLLAAMESAGDALEEAELKRAMKRNGLGTPATRAAIIETLLRRGYIVRAERSLAPTEPGRALLAALPVEALRSPRLTGEWEARLVGIAEGAAARDDFMAAIRGFAAEIVGAIREAEIADSVRASFAPATPEGAVLGACPRCGGEVRQGERGWACVSPECTLRIPSQVARRPVSPRMAKALLDRGETAPVKGFKSRQDKPFTAALKLSEAGEVTFSFPDPEALGDCPACGRPVRHRGSIFTCDTGRQCPFVVFAEMAGSAIDEACVRALLTDGESTLLTGLTAPGASSTGGHGVLRWEGRRVVVAPVDPRSKAGPAGPCSRCGADVRFDGRRWSCGDCGLRIPAEVAQRAFSLDEVAALLRDGRTPRLHGFRQKNGSVFKASCLLDPNGRIEFDFTGGDPPPPAPGGPPPAFGKRVDCPECVHRASHRPGYVIAGRAAWGCSAWRDGCGLRVPMEVEGHRLADDEALRLVSKHRATRYMKGLVGPDGPRKRTARVALRPGETPGWVVEERGG